MSESAPRTLTTAWALPSTMLEMISGGGTSNRIGIKGTEDLGNGYKVKFVLENGFDSDTGAEGSEGLAFSREATLQIESPYGILAAGRSSVLGTDGGSFNLLGNVNPFGTGIWEIGNQNIVYAKLPASRNDNAVIYRSPVYERIPAYNSIFHG